MVDYADPQVRAEAARIAAAAVRPVDPDLADRIERSRLTRDGVAEAFGPLRRGGDRDRHGIAETRRVLLFALWRKSFPELPATAAAAAINAAVREFRSDGRWNRYRSSGSIPAPGKFGGDAILFSLYRNSPQQPSIRDAALARYLRERGAE